VKLTIKKLRELIREEVGSLVYIYQKGFGNMGGSAHPNKAADPHPVILGDEEEIEKEKEHGKEEKYTQFAARVDKRNNRQR
jgi:hypothetical protein